MTAWYTSRGFRVSGVLCGLLFGFLGVTTGIAQDHQQEEEIPQGLFDDIGSIQNEEIFVVQRKFFPKAGRHEITAGILGGIPLDSFATSLLGGAAYGYHFSQNIGWEVAHVLYAQHFDTTLTEALKDNRLSPELVRPKLLASSSLSWSPIYGKVALNQNHIYHYDAYVLGGMGLSVSEQSRSPLGVAGIGFRVFVNRWFSIKFEFRDYIYSEKSYEKLAGDILALGSEKITNTFVLTLGWSVYFPKFKYNPLE